MANKTLLRSEESPTPILDSPTQTNNNPRTKLLLVSFEKLGLGLGFKGRERFARDSRERVVLEENVEPEMLLKFQRRDNGGERSLAAQETRSLFL